MASRRMRRHRADLIEIFGGHAAITECAVKHGLRTLQPIDQVYGQQLRSLEDYQKLESILLKWLPFLVIRVWHAFLGNSTSSRATRASRCDTWTWRHVLVQLARPPGQPAQEADCLAGKLARSRAGCRSRVACTNMGERFCQSWSLSSSLPSEAPPWTASPNFDYCKRDFEEHWEPPGETVCTSYFLRVSRQQESWLPLLQEAERRLKAITGNWQLLQPESFFLLEQVKTLVPWKLQRVQVFRSPKHRRLLQEVLLEGSKHRGAALWFNDDTVGIEAEEIKSIIQSSSCR